MNKTIRTYEYPFINCNIEIVLKHSEDKRTVAALANIPKTNIYISEGIKHWGDPLKEKIYSYRAKELYYMQNVDTDFDAACAACVQELWRMLDTYKDAIHNGKPDPYPAESKGGMYE